MARARGMTFEQFEPGFSIESPGRTITETDIVQFAALSGDWNSMHCDAEYAKTTPFGQRIAHGLLVLSVASGLAMQLGFMEDTVLAFRALEWKFRAPVMIGDTVHIRATVANTREMRPMGGGLVFFRIEVLNQEGKAVQKGEWELLVKGAAAAE